MKLIAGNKEIWDNQNDKPTIERNWAISIDNNEWIAFQMIITKKQIKLPLHYNSLMLP